VDQPADDWYSALFPKAACVYQFHAQLWRTARLLAARRAWRQPDDVRALIEAVFEEDAETTAALRRRDDRAFAKSRAAISLAHFNALKLHAGYTDSGDVWADDIVTPTRLGEKSVTVRLARWDGAALVPWCNAARHAWAMSDLSVRAALVADEAPRSAAHATAVDLAKESMPDKGRHAILIALGNEDGAWRGTARNGNGTEIVVEYSREFGLTIV
jgi:CRISPR-associated endonuclease/helicase Cas3